MPRFVATVAVFAVSADVALVAVSAFPFKGPMNLTAVTVPVLFMFPFAVMLETVICFEDT